METATIDHPYLGRVTGIQKSPEIRQFLGIKYAEIPSRFSEPVPFVAKDINATRYGPQAPQGPDTCNGEFDLIGQKLTLDDVVNTISETECLTVNITVPTGKRQAYNDLPVIVWVHGGNFQLGASSWPQYDLAHIVATSETMGKPIIGVSLNYRLGVLGFLTCEEMLKAGYAGNYGYKDLVAGFGWVQKYIHGFGGNPDDITALGESAGAAAVSTLLWQEEPVFQKLVAMGGSCCLIPPAPVEAHDSIFDKAMSFLGLEEKPFEEQLEALKTMPVEDLVAKTAMVVPALPAVDRIFIPKAHGIFSLSDPEDLSIPGKKWCKSMMIGDCKDDGVVMGLGILAQGRLESIPSTFPGHLAKAFVSDPEDFDLIMKHYKIDSTTSAQEAFNILTQMSSDIGFFAPVHYLAAGFPSKSFIYHFNYVNPWSGIWSGKVSHILDVAVALGNYNANGLDAAGIETCEEMQEKIIEFVNGVDPWEAFQTIGTGPMRVFGRGKGKTSTNLEDAERYVELFDLLEDVGWSKWWTAISTYL